MSLLHVFAPKHKTDIVREIIPGSSSMLRKKQMTEGESFSVPHLQVILLSLVFGESFFSWAREIGEMSRESCRIDFLGGP